MKHYEYEINLHFDGELDNEQEIELYNHLSVCRECRENFNAYNRLRRETKTVYNKKITGILFQPDSETEELNKIISTKKIENLSKYYRAGFYTSAAAAVILLFLLIAVKPKETILTRNEVRIDTVFVNKDIPVAQNQVTNAHSVTPGKRKVHVESSQKEYLRYVMSIPTITFTDAGKNSKEGRNL